MPCWRPAAPWPTKKVFDTVFRDARPEGVSPAQKVFDTVPSDAACRTRILPLPFVL